MRVLLIIFITLFCLSCNSGKSNQKEGFVFAEQLFKEYSGTKLVERKMLDKQQKQKQLLDSIVAEIQVLEASVSQNPTDKQKVSILTRRNEYTRLYNQYGEENQKEISESEQALWNQINQYVKDYGQENNYSKIFGANGTGNLMYADTSLNVTKDVIVYINKKFEGKK